MNNSANSSEIALIGALSVFFRYFEYIALVAYGFMLYWISTHLNCLDNNCTIGTFSQTRFISSVSVLIIIFGIIISIRTTLKYLEHLYQELEDNDYLYVISIVSQTLSYVFIGVFLNDVLFRSEAGFLSSPILLVIALSLTISIVSLLFDKHFWESSIFFVRVRLTLSLILQMALFFNPVLALVLSFVAVPAMVLISEKTNKNQQVL